jgi:hypothetical protein
MGETNSPSVAHVGYDISPLSRVKFNPLEWRNIVTHGQLKENLYVYGNFKFIYCYRYISDKEVTILIEEYLTESFQNQF